MSKVAVIGGGAFGTALASHAARLERRVLLWALESEVVGQVNAHHENELFLPGVQLPAALQASSDLEEVVKEADLVLLVVPSQHVRSIALRVAPFVADHATVLVAAKGIEERSLELLSTVLAQVMPAVLPERRVFLSGPSFAREVALGLPTDLVAACTGSAHVRKVQEILHAPTLRIYASSDPVGVQVGAAVKNVVAIAAGACDGMQLGTNARAALITRGLAEMTRLGVALGADPLTFLGMAGVGDLVLTCTGDLSRNRTLGKRIADGESPQAYLATQRSVAEGFATSAAAYALSARTGVEMPVTEQVYHVLHRGRPLLEALRGLVTRDFKDELQGIR